MLRWEVGIPLNFFLFIGVYSIKILGCGEQEYSQKEICEDQRLERTSFLPLAGFLLSTEWMRRGKFIVPFPRSFLDLHTEIDAGNVIFRRQWLLAKCFCVD